MKTKAIIKSSLPGIQQNITGEKQPADPLKLFRSWYHLAKSSGEHEPEAMALATADIQGKPSLRMLLYKDVLPSGFCFFTNYESRKGIEILSNPNASLLFYWPGLYRQVRIEGNIKKCPSRISDNYFNSRPLGSRISASVSPQSAVIPDRLFIEAMAEAFQRDLNQNEPKRPANWGGFVLIPNRMEFWTGRENRLHERILYRKSGKVWITEILAP